MKVQNIKVYYIKLNIASLEEGTLIERRGNDINSFQAIVSLYSNTEKHYGKTSLWLDVT